MLLLIEKNQLKRTLTLFVVCLLSIAVLFPIHTVNAEVLTDLQQNSATFTLEDFNYTDDQEFEGVLTERSFNIAFPANWRFTSEVMLTLHFSHSEALNPASSMSVDWNDQRVGSTLLTNENVNDGTFEVALSPEIINPGYNTLKIKFFMGIADDFCIDYDNPAVWAVVHTSTTFSIPYEIVMIEPELNLAPDLLIDSSLISPNEITLVIPENADLQLLNALAVMSAKLGQLADWRNISLDVLSISEASQTEPSGNLVVIATIDQIQDNIPDLSPLIASALENYSSSDPSHLPIDENDGLVTFQNSPYNPTAHAFVITGLTTQAVKKSARAASMNEFYEQSEGQWAVVLTVPQLQDSPTSTQLSFTMEDLGQEAITAYGTREQTIQFNFPLTALWNIDSEAWLALHFSHSELLNEDRSTLNVMINGIPVASIALTSKTADEGYEEVRLPLRYFNIGSNTITLEANMEYRDTRTDAQQFCTDDTYPRAWLTVHGDTAIVLPEAPEESTLNLENFPFGFADPFSFKGFAFVLSEEEDYASFEALVNVALGLGNSLEGSPADIEVLYQNDARLDDGDYDHLVLIGTIPNLFSGTLNEDLPLPIDRETGLPQSEDDILLIGTTEGIRSYIQTYEDNQHSCLVITAMQDEGLLAASELISDSAARMGLDGNVAVVSDHKNASIYQITSNESGAQTITVEQKTTVLNVSSQPIWIIRISIGVAVVSVVALLIALVVKNKKSGED